jgi:predicted RNA-binding protein
MCLAKAYLKEADDEKLLIEDVALVETDADVIRFSTLFGDKREVEGIIKAIDFQTGSIVVERSASFGAD